MSLRVRFGVFLVMTLFGGMSSAQTEKAETIFLGGKILTVDSAFSIHRAMAIRGNRILAVGSVDQIQAYRGPFTKTVQLNGKTVMPGLIDSHTHAVAGAITEFDHTIPEMETIQDVLDYISARTKVVKPGEWIWVSQIFLTRLKEQRYPTRRELDAVAPNHPTVFQTGPDASANTLALKLSEIDESWKVDDGGPGFAEKDPATGKLTGILRSCTRYLKYKSSERVPTPEEHADALVRMLRDYNRVGITSIAERDTSPEEEAIYQALHARERLNVRTYLASHVDTVQPIEKIEARIEEVAHSPLYTGDEFLRRRAIKTYLDGGMLTGSAFMQKPWGVSKLYGITDPEYRGLQFIPSDKLRQIIGLCMKNRIQFTSHSVGDGAVHAFLDACRALSGQYDVREARPVICHSNFMSEEAVRAAAELGVTADIQPAWLYLDGRTLNQHFGYDRMTWFQPLKSLFAAGAIAGGGSDHMQKLGSLRSINFYDPWMGLWVAMTRNARWLDTPLHPEQALSRVEAIRFYTINNAYLLFMEKEIGSLEPGKLADFIVLSDDVMTCPVDRIRDIKVELTYLGGRQVHPVAP